MIESNFETVVKECNTKAYLKKQQRHVEYLKKVKGNESKDRALYQHEYDKAVYLESGKVSKCVSK